MKLIWSAPLLLAVVLVTTARVAADREEQTDPALEATESPSMVPAAHDPLKPAGPGRPGKPEQLVVASWPFTFDAPDTQYKSDADQVEGVIAKAGSILDALTSFLSMLGRGAQGGEPTTESPGEQFKGDY